MAILQSASMVLQLLVKRGRPMSVSEIAHALQTPKSSTSRLLKQMLGADLLERDRKSLAYGPGEIMLELGKLVQAHTPMLKRIEQELRELVTLTGHTGFISVLDSTLHHVIVLRVVHGTETLRIVTEAGKRNSSAGTSTGRALLARLTDNEIEDAFGETLATSNGDASPSLRQLKDRLADTRRLHWASALNESLPHIGSVSCAIGNPDTGQAWAFCLSFPAVLAEQQGFVEEISRLLLRSARLLGRAVSDPNWL